MAKRTVDNLRKHLITLPDPDRYLERYRVVWRMKKAGATYAQIGEALDVSGGRARQMYDEMKFLSSEVRTDIFAV